MYVHHYEKYCTQFPTVMVMYFYSNLSVTIYIWKCAEILWEWSNLARINSEDSWESMICKWSTCDCPNGSPTDAVLFKLIEVAIGSRVPSKISEQYHWTKLSTITQENKTGKHLFLWAIGKSPNAKPISTDAALIPPSQQLLEVSMSEGSKGGSLQPPRWTGHRVWAGQVASVLWDVWPRISGSLFFLDMEMTWWCQMMSRCQGIRMNLDSRCLSGGETKNFQGYTMSIPRTCPATVGQRSWGTYRSCYERSWPVNTRYVKAKTLSTLQATWGRSIREPTFQIN